MIDKRVIESNVVWGSTGLVPTVVQDAATGRVLMLAYMDAEALAATLQTGQVHFHSRSRDRLWRKGETSGNALILRDMAVDCDGDALLVQADPTGPACHRGTASCFDAADAAYAPEEPLPRLQAAPPGAPVLPATAPQPASAGQGFDWLETLWATIESRVGADPASSYTARLLGGGVDATARKVAEEAVEVVMGAKDDASAGPGRRQETRQALVGEVADLLYHTLVLLRERGLEPAAVIAALRERHKG
jgi:phosphoribosyl-ATP pyrophosphohydrolase/phosphoribosyl-AMP cyclohydrolase